MLDASQLGVFAVACLALLALPGPAVLYIVARGVDQGRAAALVSVAGIHVGTIAHVVAAAIGISAVLAASATAFTAVKLLGAAYLIWLGIQRLRAPDQPEPDAIDRRHPGSLRRVFTQGVVVNVLNPKTAIFFLAFLPQFTDPARGSVALQLVALGLIFIALGLLTDGVYAVASGVIGSWLRPSGTDDGESRRQKGVRWATGGTYVALGVGTALSGGSSPSS